MIYTNELHPTFVLVTMGLVGMYQGAIHMNRFKCYLMGPKKLKLKLHLSKCLQHI
jgi:hypothetical protein